MHRGLVLLGLGAFVCLLAGVHRWVDGRLEVELIQALREVKADMDQVAALETDIKEAHALLVDLASLPDAPTVAQVAEVLAELDRVQEEAGELRTLRARAPEEQALTEQIVASVDRWVEPAKAAVLAGPPLPMEDHRTRFRGAAEAVAKLRRVHREIARQAADRIHSIHRQRSLLDVAGLLLQLSALGLAVWWARRTGQARVHELAAIRSRELIQRLAASVAHEVNNQLGVLQNVTGLMSRSGVSAELLAYQQQSLDQVARLTADLVSFGAPGGRAWKRLDLAELAHQMAPLVEAPVQVESAEPVQVWCEADRMRQAVLNLVRNAVEAGGPVTVAVERHAAGARLSVTDRGPGLARAAAERLGEPFFSTKARGAGLGLALVKQVAEEHGATFVLANLPDGGARAELWFPAASAALSGGPRAVAS